MWEVIIFKIQKTDETYYIYDEDPSNKSKTPQKQQEFARTYRTNTRGSNQPKITSLEGK